MASRIEYERYKLMTEGKRSVKPPGCYETIVQGRKFIECVVNGSSEKTRQDKDKVVVRRPAEEVEVEQEDVDRHRDVDLVIFGPENRPDEYVEPDDGMDRNQPTKLPKYPKKLDPSSCKPP